MAEELLDRIRREIADRMAQSRSAYEGSVRLEAALVALDATRDAEHARGEPVRGNVHAGFGERVGETDQPKG